MFTKLQLVVLFCFGVAAPGLAQAQETTDPTAEVADASVADAGAPVVAPDAGPAAPVDPIAEAEKDPVGTGQKLLTAVREGNWRLVVALALSLFVLAVSRWRSNTKWFSGKRGGAIFMALVSFATVLAGTLVTSMPVDWKMLLTVLGTTWTAVGGYTWFRDLLGISAAEIERAKTNPDAA